ncbi:MAG: DUF4293 domain-containing protein [Bacteroidales bacterium]|nr:DUF4293 domain-containing protein [Bacteroidales bacterium]
MIQRIQTLFLLLAAICMSLFYFMPFGSVVVESPEGINDVALGLYGADFGEKSFSTLPLLILVSFVVLTTIFTIFLYKHRIAQMRICVFNLVMALGCSGLAFFYLYQAAETFGTDFNTKITIVFPIVAVILIILAIRAIAKDEALVRSIDRIR